MLSIPAGERYLGVWVYGDGSGNTLLATITDQSLQSRQLLLTALDFTGWKHVSAALPEGAVAVSALDVIYGGGRASRRARSGWTSLPSPTRRCTIPRRPRSPLPSAAPPSAPG